MSIYAFGKKKAFDPAAYAADKKKQKEEAYALADTTLVNMMTDRGLFQRYLKAQGQFDRYSVNNAALISAQMPTAKLLKSKKDWKALGIDIHKGARAVTILEPHPYTRSDGRTATGYDVKEVYDISQTSEAGSMAMEAPLPVRTVVRALIEASPVPVKPTAELDRDAYYDPSQRVVFAKKGLPAEQLISALAREACSAVYDIKFGEDAGKTMKPAMAAYMVCIGCGVDSEQLAAVTDPKMLGTENAEEFKDILSGMREVNHEIQAGMYKVLHRNDPSQEEHEHDERA